MLEECVMDVEKEEEKKFWRKGCNGGFAFDFIFEEKFDKDLSEMSDIEGVL